MARKRFTPEQIVAILREAERGAERKALFRKHGISEQTFYRWKRMYGGLGASEIKRIKQLEEESRKICDINALNRRRQVRKRVDFKEGKR